MVLTRRFDLITLLPVSVMSLVSSQGPKVLMSGEDAREGSHLDPSLCSFGAAV
jgi:hypothetical protein